MSHWVKNLLDNAGDTGVQSLVWEDPLEKEKATHSSILSWKIPWTERSLVDCDPSSCKDLDITETT